MHRLSQLIILCLFVKAGFGQNQSPHGDDFVIDCNACHNSGSWEIDMSTIAFNHDTVGFPLDGEHASITCKACHTSLEFDQVQNDCASCHDDVHSMSVGNDCARCHTTESWLVDNIQELHEQNGFPLIGAHDLGLCTECHLNESNLRWDPVGNECVSCHMDDYLASESPDHVAAGISTDCMNCHTPISEDWMGDQAHFFFPLVDGHDLNNCFECHNQTTFTGLSPACIECHRADFESTTMPNHLASNFDNDCAQCHNLTPGWSQIKYLAHDGRHFPIYSGEHQGTWDACTDCHGDPTNYSTFDCLICHNNEADLLDEHNDVGGYQYNSAACFSCHPNGD